MLCALQSAHLIIDFSLIILKHCVTEHTGLLKNNSHTNTNVPPFVLLDSLAVREFLCLDDPPGPFDSLEESRVSVTSIYIQPRCPAVKVEIAGTLVTKRIGQKQPIISYMLPYQRSSVRPH